MGNEKFLTYLAGAFAPFRDLSDWRDYVISNTGNKRIKARESSLQNNCAHNS